AADTRSLDPPEEESSDESDSSSQIFSASSFFFSSFPSLAVSTALAKALSASMSEPPKVSYASFPDSTFAESSSAPLSYFENHMSTASSTSSNSIYSSNQSASSTSDDQTKSLCFSVLFQSSSPSSANFV